MSRSYEAAADVVAGVLARKGSVRSLSFDPSADIGNRRACYALALSVLSHSASLTAAVDYLAAEDAKSESAGADVHDLIFTSSMRGPVLARRRALVMVLIHELFYSRSQKIAGGGALKRLLTQYKSYIADVIVAHPDPVSGSSFAGSSESNVVYVRANTLVASMESVLAELRGLSDTVAKAEPDEHLSGCVVRVELVPGVAPNALNRAGAVRARRVIVQSKPSCMPPIVLAPEPGSRVIDCCAAPGNKTSLLAALMENKGELIAFDRDAQRLATMQKLLAASGVKCATTLHRDFLTTSPQERDLQNPDYILLDPSCSGSGLLDRPEAQRESRTGKDMKRIRTLSHFQLQMLRHALTFKPKRLVYSTCSVHKEEDEEVVALALQGLEGEYVLRDALPAWHRRGLGEIFPGAKKCLRCIPSQDGITGFFVALFVRRDQCSEEELQEAAHDLDGFAIQQTRNARPSHNNKQNGNIRSNPHKRLSEEPPAKKPFSSSSSHKVFDEDDDTD